MLEKTIERAVCKAAKAAGWLCFKFTSPGNVGVPDRLFIKDGRHIFIEFKAPGRQPRKIQIAVINKMIATGAEVYIVDDIQEGKEILGC